MWDIKLSCAHLIFYDELDRVQRGKYNELFLDKYGNLVTSSSFNYWNYANL